MGLLLTHKRKLRVWGDMMSVSGVNDGDRSGGGKRGEVKVFSRESRYRLFRLLHTLTFERVTFLTLTYPDVFPVDSKVYKGHLCEFHRKFEVQWPGIQGVWRLEFQKRGAPHFHIMLLDCPYVDVGELCWMWKSTCHTWDMAHELLGVDLKLISDSRQEALIASYLAKYIAKVDEEDLKNDKHHAGRWWGKWNIEEPAPMEFEISDREAQRIVAFVLGARVGNQGWQPVDPTLCTVFGCRLGSSEFGELVRGYQNLIRKPAR